ncbi:hypothetical protein VOLCADRAFT_119797 [Volvox carteri f. nagariensis]|uniref:Uncharacterized protein n=1 Tax=Volvox carteri f. nagariensis TaxID=3068 RepID=D8UGR9_VOLCA|nr:uncharacterized protein VOLCADRAFT_119797 [Volvox carteri f. nagariensis]EFJ41076.1 hypothetical protein VOLCADRAFT_119797 [Volvox carteri f. nagariensis]|eukprot:XP_002957839.1 hypothetical protein VOLCADRAFT_119797 [Volvox carteri f. nagariensis]
MSRMCMQVDGAKWDAWNRALAGTAGVLAVGGRKDDGSLAKLYDIAVELRERLRYSQARLRNLKQELSATAAAARSERHEAMIRLQELETEVARLAGAVQAQGSTLAARETVSQSQAAENEQLRRHIARLEGQLQRCEEDRRVTISERNDALRHLDRMTRLLEESEARVAAVQAEHSNLLDEMVAAKGRLADLSALETLYGAARDELQRLDKENLELKDIAASGGPSISSRPLSPAGGRMLQLSPSRAASQSYSQSYSQSCSPPLEDPVSEMAFLGPPSSAYPPDPENYLFYRVGGGYEARVDPTQPTNPQPRASGWVPKDVVRLVQAFRHSYGLNLEWRFWEPLVLLIDEVYRNRAGVTLAAMRAAQREKLKAIKRQVRAALGYPSAVANGKINHLQRQLNSARKILALTDRKEEQPLRQMAMKDYHLGYQLDRSALMILPGNPSSP